MRERAREKERERERERERKRESERGERERERKRERCMYKYAQEEYLIRSKPAESLNVLVFMVRVFHINCQMDPVNY